ncbi:MAG: HEAT repeat domain-containing protein, partial [Candidatus Thorarchaeota archaeon]
SVENIGMHNESNVDLLLYLDDVLVDDHTDYFCKMLESLTEDDSRLPRFRLMIRDHIFEYLDCRAVYFSLYTTGYSLLEIASKVRDRQIARSYIGEHIQHLVEQNRPYLDQSFLEIDELRESRFIVLLPIILERRSQELESCRIQYSTSSKGTRTRYCISEILKTHYGKKIAAALDLDLRNPIIGESDFFRLEKGLFSLDLNVEEMLFEIDADQWSHLFVNQTESLNSNYLDSAELTLLFETANARLQLGTDTNHIKKNALNRIVFSKTKNCNDSVGRIACSESSEEIRIEAIRLLERTKDVSQIELLSSLLSESSGGVKSVITKAISVLSSVHFTSTIKPLSSDAESSLLTPEIIGQLEYSKLFEQVSKSISFLERIDAARSLPAANTRGSESSLWKMMDDEDSQVRFAVVDAAESLPREEAYRIIVKAIQDQDPEIVSRATSILESRWPDDYW